LSKHMAEMALALAVAGLVLGGLANTDIKHLKEQNAEQKQIIDNLKDAITNETATREEQDKELKKDIIEERTARESEDNHLNTAVGKLFDEINKIRTDLVNHIKEANAQIELIKDSLNRHQQDIEKAKENITALNKITKNQGKTIHSQGEKIHSIEERVADIQNNINLLTVQTENLKITLKTTSDQIQEQRQNINQLQQQIAQANSQIESQTNQIDTVSRQTESLTQDVTDINNQIDSMTADIADLYDTSNELYNATIDLYNATIENQREILWLWQNITEIMNQLSQEIGYWQSLRELEDWLAYDTTDQNEYIPTVYDCDDFATDLARNALKIDRLIYPIPVTTDLYYNSYWLSRGYYMVPSEWIERLYFEDWDYIIGNHMVDLTYCQDVGWVAIEPQTDEIAVLGRHEL